MSVTLSGITIEIRLVQPENARLPISITFDGMFTEVRFEQ